MATPPASPQTVIDGNQVPVIPKYALAAFTSQAVLGFASAPGAPAPGSASGLGTLTASAKTTQNCTLAWGASGSATGRTVVTGAVVISAGFGTTSSSIAADATFSGSMSLSAQVAPTATAFPAFYGRGAIAGIIPVNVGQIQLSGAGTLSATAAMGFKPSGMTKSGTQTTPTTQNTWAQITAWTADTANYPGSTVTSNALVSQGSKVSATVSASVGWTKGTLGNSIQIRLKQNGAVIATGATSSTGAGSTATATASTTVTVANTDQITVEVADAGSYASYPATITAGSTTYLRIS